jgi:hypothetical protein
VSASGGLILIRSVPGQHPGSLTTAAHAVLARGTCMPRNVLYTDVQIPRSEDFFTVPFPVSQYCPNISLNWGPPAENPWYRRYQYCPHVCTVRIILYGKYGCSRHGGLEYDEYRTYNRAWRSVFEFITHTTLMKLFSCAHISIAKTYRPYLRKMLCGRHITAHRIRLLTTRGTFEALR